MERNGSVRNVCLLLVYCALLYGLMSGAVPLLDPDEPVYGETAKEMLATGDWLSPRIYGEFWYDKPPLFYWLDGISFSLFGVSTWAARLPSAIAGALCSAYVYLASKKVIGERTALFSSIILASSLEFIVLARSAVTDMTLTLALTIALLSFLRKDHIIAYIACGFALLAKGPIGFGFPALIVGIWLIASRNFTWKSITALRWYWGIPLASLVGLPWFLYMASVHGSAFIDTFLGYHNITRFTSPEHAGANHIWLYIVVLLAGFFPWFGTVPGALCAAWKKRTDTARLYFFVWALFIFIFFSLSSTQLFSYILPMFPPLSLLAGMYLADVERAKKKSAALPICHGFCCLLAAAAIGLAPMIPDGGIAVRYGIAAGMALLTLLSAWLLYEKKISFFMMAQAGLSLLFTLSIWFFFASPVASDFTSKAITEKLAATKINGALYIDPFYRPSTAFYGDIYGKPLPSFSKSATEKEKQDEDNHVVLPTESSETFIPGGAYILVQKKLVTREWPDALKNECTLIWEKDTAYLFRKENP